MQQQQEIKSKEEMIGHIKMFDRYLADCVNIKKKCKRK
jgi:hypothetical protein